MQQNMKITVKASENSIVEGKPIKFILKGVKLGQSLNK